MTTTTTAPSPANRATSPPTQSGTVARGGRWPFLRLPVVSDNYHFSLDDFMTTECYALLRHALGCSHGDSVISQIYERMGRHLRIDFQSLEDKSFYYLVPQEPEVFEGSDGDSDIEIPFSELKPGFQKVLYSHIYQTPCEKIGDDALHYMFLRYKMACQGGSSPDYRAEWSVKVYVPNKAKYNDHYEDLMNNPQSEDI